MACRVPGQLPLVTLLIVAFSCEGQKSMQGTSLIPLRELAGSTISSSGSSSSKSASGSHSSSQEDQGGQGDHGHEPVEISEPELVIAWLMVLFVAFNMALLYLVNSFNPYFRKTAYKVVCIALSVYCAVLFNQALFGFITEICAGKTTPFQEMVLAVIIFVVFLVLLHVLCYRFRRTPHALRAIQLVGAHVTAFAGIEGFGRLQSSEAFQRWLFDTIIKTDQTEILSRKAQVAYFCMIFITTLSFIIIFAVARQFAKGMAGKVDGKAENGSKKPLYKEVGMHGEEKEPEWLVVVQEAKEEAAGLVLGFLSLQMTIFVVTDRKPPIHDVDEEHPVGHAMALFGVGFFVIVLLVLTAYLKGFWNMMSTRSRRDKPEARHSPFNVRQTLAMVMAWILSRAAAWLMYRKSLFSGIEMARVATAFCLSVLSVVCIVTLNALADRTGLRQARLKKAKELLEKDTATNHDVREALHALDKDENEESRMFEEALEIIIDGFAVLIGLTWDKAFEASEEIIVHGTPVMKDHPIKSKAIMAVVLCAIVLPGWTMHILPAADLTWYRHLEIIMKKQEAMKPEEE